MRTPDRTGLVTRGRLLLYHPALDLLPSQTMWLGESNMILNHTSWFLDFKNRLLGPANKAFINLHLDWH